VVKLLALAALPAFFILGICAQSVRLSSLPVSGRSKPESLQSVVSPDYDLTALIGVFAVCAFVVHNYVNLNIGLTLMLMQAGAYSSNGLSSVR
jgi:hypothetical protein